MGGLRSNAMNKEVTAAAEALAAELKADIFVCNAPIERGTDRKIISLVHSRKRLRPNVLLVGH